MTLASNSKINGEVADFTYGLIPNDPATWDYNRMFGCNCDDGWHGYDCSLRSCLTGDDPNSQGQLDEIQSLKCIVAAGNSGVLVFTFRGSSTGPIASPATTAQVKAALEALPTITSVAVELADLPLISYSLQNVDNFAVEEVAKGNKK